MKNFLLLFVFAAASTISTNAQSLSEGKSTASYILDVIANITYGNSVIAHYKATVGASIQAEVPVAPSVAITGSGGYQRYNYKRTLVPNMVRNTVVL